MLLQFAIGPRGNRGWETDEAGRKDQVLARGRGQFTRPQPGDESIGADEGDRSGDGIEDQPELLVSD